MRQKDLVIAAFVVCVLASEPVVAADPNDAARPAQAAVIPCKGLIDQGLLDSIERRSETAMKAGADYLIYEIETYGGLVDAADSIAKYFIQTIGPRARTVAYIQTEAISAGALISVSCNDIIMRDSTTIGDCAPITLGGTLEGVEREKAESFIRAAFQRAAEANGYPELLLKAMVTMQTEVWRVKNLATGQWEFFETKNLPSDANEYDVDGAQEVVGSDELLTLTASQALEYGIARAVVGDLDKALAFLEERDGVRFDRPPMRLETTWSEEMVRWLNSPAVMGVLIMLALLGVYIEFSTPGVGLPGLVAVICFALIVGSKYLTGLANWVEIVLLLSGVILLLVELLVLPGFGIAGILGIVFILGGLFGMLIKNAPGQLPWPEGPEDWASLTNGLLGIVYGFVGFAVLAFILSRYLPKLRFLSGLILVPAPAVASGTVASMSMTAPPQSTQRPVRVGDVGEVTSKLRPAGKARFGDAVVDVVAMAEFLDKGMQVEIVEIHGNRVVVKGRDNA
ncbi:MAG TPA: NfeD family protein [Sedimentisphaerales bacterium]|nr:NfeD family protein [Sedimentisphaerales bacterium]HRS12022.1 NfeD family protein [Sedimentisphaerales bacterium]HRV48545.1 NfeD family protein [Sedimentisphaerales bacterium]